MTALPVLPPRFGVAKQMFEIERVDYLSPDARGRIGAVTAGFPLWKLDWQLGSVLTTGLAEEWRAFVQGRRGAQRLFYGYDLLRRAPRAHAATNAYTPTATSWSQSIDADGFATLTLNGLAPGQIVSTGDYIGFEWSSWKRALVRAQSLAVANASGTVATTIDPPVPSLVPNGGTPAVATLRNPTCLMRILSSESSGGSAGRRGVVEGGRIVAIQDLVP